MKRLSRKLDQVLAAIAAGMFFVFILSVTYQVAARHVAFVPRAYWTEEIARMAFIWMVFIAAATGIRKREHFVLDIFPMDKLRLFMNTPAVVISDVAVLTISIYIIYGGITFSILGLNRYSSTSGFELIFFYISIPVSGLIFCIFTTLNIIQNLNKMDDLK